MQERQDLILYIAQLHATAIADGRATGKPRGFCEVQMRLMSLRTWVHDYRVVLDHFFDVTQTGYNFGDAGHEISTIVPKALDIDTIKEVESKAVTYLPPIRPDDGVVSKVYVQQHNASRIRQKLAQSSRPDLKAPVEWLLQQKEINFTFQRAGKLRQRDTSTWPIVAIETWPGWLREDLFGAGIDIDSAYTQYLLQCLQQIYADTPELLKTLFPDLIRSLEDKACWRFELCDVLGLPHADDSVRIVKTICMSLANGSRISPGILQSGRAFSVTAEIIIRATDDVSVENLEKIGNRLQYISRQYANAKRAICTAHLKLNPSLRNQKQVFSSYFEWEREARYLIWEAVDRHGLMVHDGIDGIPEEYLSNIPALIAQIGLKVTT
jgi:hypothetical protein